MTQCVIQTNQVVKRYGNVLALDHVSVHVRRGEIYGLIGDNGAGKSTLLKLLAGHIFATGGEVSLFGESGEKGLALARREIGVMIEQPGFFPQMTIAQNMAYYRRLKGVPGAQKEEEILRMVGLWDKRASKGKSLSMGMKQRLGLAIAMLGEPQVLLLDEPINGLDPSGIVDMRNLLHRLNQERKITILLSSHILPELQQTATTFGFLSHGRIMEEISARDLHERCADCLLLRVSDAESYTAHLGQRFPQERFSVMQDGMIRLLSPAQDAAAYSALAAEHGILILEMTRHSQSLEDYYMELKKLKGGERHA